MAFSVARQVVPDGSRWYVVDLGAEFSDIFGQEVTLGGKSIDIGCKAIHVDDAGRAMHAKLLELGQVAPFFEKGTTRIRPTQAATAGGDLSGGVALCDLHAIYGAGKAVGSTLLAEEGQNGEVKDDDRTLWVDVDAHRERNKSWRDVAMEGSERAWGKEWTFPGPLTVMHLIKRFDRAGGDDPRQCFLLWCRENNIGSTDRTFYEVKTLVDYFYYSGCVDQVDLCAFLGAEVVSWRLQQYVDAHATGGDRPNCDSASLVTHADSVSDIVFPGSRLYVSQRARDQANLQLVRDRRRALATGQPYVEDAIKEGVLPAPRPAAKPRPRKGAKGVGKAGAGEAQ